MKCSICLIISIESFWFRYNRCAVCAQLSSSITINQFIQILLQSSVIISTPSVNSELILLNVLSPAFSFEFRSVTLFKRNNSTTSELWLVEDCSLLTINLIYVIIIVHVDQLRSSYKSNINLGKP